MKSILTKLMVLIVVLATSQIFAGEVSISLNEVPARVKKAAMDKLKNFELVYAAKEMEDGQLEEYILKGRIGTQGYEVEVSPEGKVTDIEVEDEAPIEIAKLPANILKEVAKRIPGCKIFEAEVKVKGKKHIYEIEGKAGDTVYEIELDEDGKLISFESEEDDDDDEDEE